MPVRCSWATTSLDISYHDTEWGVPVHDDRRLFEFLVLEGAQAGLSWSTILKKRDHYHRAFRGFDPATVAAFTARDVRRLLADAGIVRNRLKIESAISNGGAFGRVQEEFGSFDAYVWRFVGGTPLQPGRRDRGRVPARTALSDTLSEDLRQRGFRFVGTTICYAYMQATGLVNDHVVTCFRHRALGGGERTMR